MNFNVTERTLKEKVIDKLLLLYLFKKHRFDSRIKLQKTVFFIQDFLTNKKIKAFSYDFIRYKHGQYSKELQDDFLDLIKEDVVTQVFTLTEKGEEILKRSDGTLNKNAVTLRHIDAIASHVTTKPTYSVKDMAYNKVFRAGRPVKDVSEGEVLLIKMKENDTELKFELDDKWLQKLEIMFNQDVISSTMEFYDLGTWEDIDKKDKEIIKYLISIGKINQEDLV